jgi:hypothetical protein
MWLKAICPNTPYYIVQNQKGMFEHRKDAIYPILSITDLHILSNENRKKNYYIACISVGVHKVVWGATFKSTNCI